MIQTTREEAERFTELWSERLTQLAWDYIALLDQRTQIETAIRYVKEVPGAVLNVEEMVEEGIPLAQELKDVYEIVMQARHILESLHDAHTPWAIDEVRREAGKFLRTTLTIDTTTPNNQVHFVHADPQPTYKLCYVDGNFAWFTLEPLDKQWGDDWNDRPYQDNAGPPYELSPLQKVAFDGNFETPSENFAWFTVKEINRGEVPWLSGLTQIYAGVSIDEFTELIEDGGGHVYLRRDQQ